MKSNKEIRAAARQSLNGHWGWAILACLIAGAIGALISLPQSMSNASITAGNAFGLSPIAGLGMMMIGSSITCVLSIFALGPVQAGVANAFNRFYSKAEYNTVSNLFSLGFGGGRYWRNVLGMFLRSLFIALWMLLFIVPGIIKAYAYALTPFILLDNPELGPNEARLRSIEMMRGYKGKLFGLELSFIGWFLLCILSLGVGFIWLLPYVNTSYAAFYRERADEYNAKTATAVEN